MVHLKQNIMYNKMYGKNAFTTRTIFRTVAYSIYVKKMYDRNQFLQWMVLLPIFTVHWKKIVSGDKSRLPTTWCTANMDRNDSLSQSTSRDGHPVLCLTGQNRSNRLQPPAYFPVEMVNFRFFIFGVVSFFHFQYFKTVDHKTCLIIPIQYIFAPIAMAIKFANLFHLYIWGEYD